MKLNFKHILAVAAIMTLGSCTKDAVAPLTGMYEKPTVYEMNTLVSQSVEKGENSRIFTVELTDGAVSLTMKFVGDKYYLHDAGFTAATADAAKKGNYIVGSGGSTFNPGGNPVNVDKGTLTVAQSEGVYSFKGILWLADESVIEVKSSVSIAYEADPEPVLLTNVLSAASNLANGTNTVTMQLAQDGIYSEIDMSTYQTVWHGEGNYLAIDLYSADGYLHEGTYTACTTGGVVGEGEFGIGYDTTVDWGWGPMEMKDWGTCWWTVSNGAATAEKILEGTVTVTKKGSEWVIELISGEGKDAIWAKFTGAIEALTDKDDSETDYVELVNLISAQSNIPNAYSVSINMATEGVTATYDQSQWSYVYSGTGNYLSLDVYSADGKLAAGTYKANSTGGSIAEGEFGIGYDADFGFGMTLPNWGTCWWTVTDGATSAEKVLDGTLTVEVSGSTYTIVLESNTVNARYIGTLTL